MTTPHPDPYPPPGADVPGAPPPLLRDRRHTDQTRQPRRPQPQPPQCRQADRRGTLTVAALAAAAAALVVVAQRWHRHRHPSTPR